MAQRIFGEIAGYPPGSTFQSRQALADSGVHRPLQAGISGSATEGADSIVLSGGYEDDLDEGDWIIYTGDGGNDPDTGAQIANQQLSHRNRALTVSASEGLPVRAIRGAGHRSKYSPTQGYRYDGLYYVDRYWHDIGKSGYLIYRFFLRKADILAPLYSINEQADIPVADRRPIEIQRIVRNTAMASEVKRINGYRCQVCDTRLETSAGPYAEGAHIRPLGRPHNGPDVRENILCMCPNHHLLFDRGAFSVQDNFRLIGIDGVLRVERAHHVHAIYLAYHREHYLDPGQRVG
jgi:putative restriction endonuclease